MDEETRITSTFIKRRPNTLKILQVENRCHLRNWRIVAIFHAEPLYWDHEHARWPELNGHPWQWPNDGQRDGSQWKHHPMAPMELTQRKKYQRNFPS